MFSLGSLCSCSIIRIMKNSMIIILQCICNICFGQTVLDSSRTISLDSSNNYDYGNKSMIRLNDFYCSPAPKNLVLFYDIDGVILNDKKKATSCDYCKINPEDICGMDIEYLFKKKKLRHVITKVNSKESKEVIRYLSDCDSKIYGWNFNDTVVPIVCFRIKTKLPLVLNDTIYYRYKEKKKAVRRYNYNNLFVEIIGSDMAKKKYGWRARNGIIYVNALSKLQRDQK